MTIRSCVHRRGTSRGSRIGHHALALALALGALASGVPGCGNGAPADDSGVDGDSPGDLGDDRTPRLDGPLDGRVTRDGAAGPDADGHTLPGKLPAAPAGAVVLHITVDDTIDKAYAARELLLKGAFSFDEKTHVIKPDADWTGPFVPLHDDGPSGLEGPGSAAGDHKLGATFYVVPGSTTTIEYGVSSPAGWMWPDSGNLKLTVSPGDPPRSVAGFAIPPRAGVDVTWIVDAGQLAGGWKVDQGYQAVVVRGNVTHWGPLPCLDDGTSGDAVKNDGKLTCRLSAEIGKGRRFPHLGLARPGSTVRFFVEIGGSGYRETAGISASLGSSPAAVGKTGGDLTLAVPANAAVVPAPLPDSSPLPPGLRGDPPKGQLTIPSSVGIAGHIYVPLSYDAHRPTALLVALHGAYEKGSWMVGTWKQLSEDLGYVLLAPSSFGQSWDLTSVFGGKTAKEDQPILDAINHVQQRYNIKANQVAVNGFSDGASMSLYMGLTHGKIFCAAIANSAGGMGKKYGLADRPAIFLTHGDADTVLPVGNARYIRDTLEGLGYDVTYLELPGVGHVFPTEQKIPMLRWFDAHAR